MSGTSRLNERRWRYRGITKAAADFGITRNHLYQVLSGRRRSARTLARWEAWQASRKEEAHR